ncbi:histidinol dehydrogenase, partial [Bacillus thuringiensis]|nr:histidinol dehydrogenase [Bacillus thuringiensis]
MFRYFKFKLNDTVQFAENDGHMYRIVGYRLEKGFYPKDEWTHIIYELLREFDGYT